MYVSVYLPIYLSDRRIRCSSVLRTFRIFLGVLPARGALESLHSRELCLTQNHMFWACEMSYSRQFYFRTWRLPLWSLRCQNRLHERWMTPARFLALCQFWIDAVASCKMYTAADLCIYFRPLLHDEGVSYGTYVNLLCTFPSYILVWRCIIYVVTTMSTYWFFREISYGH